MLKNSLYQIISTDCTAGVIEAIIELDKKNEIFEGHFPGQPVLPGVCMLQMVKEVFEASINQNIRLQKANQIKFLSIIDPSVNIILNLNITYQFVDNSITINAKLITNDLVAFKFQGVFSVRV